MANVLSQLKSPPQRPQSQPSPLQADVKAHLKRFKPKLVQQLRSQSPQALDQYVRELVQQGNERHARLLKQGLNQIEADELVNELLFPTGEKPNLQ